MNNVLTIGIIISVILGVAGFVASNNYIVGAVILILSILYFVFLANPLFKKYLLKINRFNECYNFINNYIVSLSMKNSIVSAYESAISSMPESFSRYIENIETFSEQDKLEHIHKYFRFHVFSLFIDLINIYQDEGGDILEMSHYLLEEARQVEEYIQNGRNRDCAYSSG